MGHRSSVWSSPINAWMPVKLFVIQSCGVMWSKSHYIVWGFNVLATRHNISQNLKCTKSSTFGQFTQYIFIIYIYIFIIVNFTVNNRLFCLLPTTTVIITITKYYFNDLQKNMYTDELYYIIIFTHKHTHTKVVYYLNFLNKLIKILIINKATECSQISYICHL